LAADRQEYNPTTPMIILADLRALQDIDSHTGGSGIQLANHRAEFRLRVARIDEFGGREDLTDQGHEPILFKQLANQELVHIPVVTVQFGASHAMPQDYELKDDFIVPFVRVLSRGDRIELTLLGKIFDDTIPVSSDFEVSTTVQVVAQPVTPPPEAAYALIRRLSDDPAAPVECVRFAWGPSAEKIELVDPSDLLRQSVRRRATFLWRDAIRPTGVVNDSGAFAAKYAVQKLFANGSTLVPPFFDYD
jgi:hypothetical protein